MVRRCTGVPLVRSKRKPFRDAPNTRLFSVALYACFPSYPCEHAVRGVRMCTGVALVRSQRKPFRNAPKPELLHGKQMLRNRRGISTTKSWEPSTLRSISLLVHSVPICCGRHSRNGLTLRPMVLIGMDQARPAESRWIHVFQILFGII